MTRSQWLSFKLPFSLGRSKPQRERRVAKAERTFDVTLPDGRTCAAVQAHTKSEARARAKRILEVPRLPAGTVVEAA
jgi:hypothetical protein